MRIMLVMFYSMLNNRMNGQYIPLFLVLINRRFQRLRLHFHQRGFFLAALLSRTTFTSGAAVRSCPSPHNVTRCNGHRGGNCYACIVTQEECEGGGEY